MHRFSTDSRTAVVVTIILSVLYFLIRCTFLDRMVTTDEMHWVGRSGNFFRALQTGELQYTYQMAHPGVMTMWSGAIAYYLYAPSWPNFIGENVNNSGGIIDTLLKQNGIEPLHLLNFARIIKILMQTILFTGCLLFMRRLFPPLVVILGGILIIFDPFLSGHDSVLQIDGMFAIASTCAVLSVAWAFSYGVTTRWVWIVSGAVSATSWLTRTTGLLIPVLVGGLFGFLIIWQFWKGRTDDSRRYLVEHVSAGLLWLASLIVMSLLLFPALWFDPSYVLAEIWSFTRYAAVEGHESALFFNGEIIVGDPGLRFYPVTLLWRLTPVTQFGLLMFALFGWRSYRSKAFSLTSLRTTGWILLFVCVFTVGMSVGAKKFDRYLLPVYPLLDILAACGIVFLAHYLVSSWPRMKVYFVPVTISLIFILQGWATLSVLPYRLDYFNPLLGGAVGAEDELQLGWGEGADQVLGYVTPFTRTDDEVIVVTSSWYTVLNWLDTGHNDHLILNPQNGGDRRYNLFRPDQWYETDFFALGIQEEQRDKSDVGKFLTKETPVFIAWVEGVPYFKVYRLNATPFPAWLQKETGCTLELSSGLTLLQVDQTQDSIDLYFLTTAPDRTNQVDVTLSQHGVWADGTEFEYTDTTALYPATDGMLSKVSVPKRTGDNQIFTFGISMTDPESGDPITLRRPGSEAFLPTSTIPSDCYTQALFRG